MAVTDDELEVDLGTDPPQDPPPGGGDTPPDKTPEQIELEDLRSQVGDLRGKTALLDQLGPLLPAAKAALERWGTPMPTGDAKPDPEVMRQIGEKLQSTLVTGKPEDVAAMFFDSVRQISNQTTQTAINEAGAPMVEKLADFTLGSYLTMRGAEDPAKAKTHELVVKEIRLSPRERQIIGAGKADEAREVLDGAYERAAGRVLMRAKPRAQNLGGGGGGGGTANADPSTAPPAGWSPRDWEQQLRTMEVLWPDEKVRAQKLKELREDLAE